MENTQQKKSNKEASYGNVYVMTHSFFSDVIKIGCIPSDPHEHAKVMSAETIGDYKVVYSLKCLSPCKVKNQIRAYLNAKEYVDGFYQVPAEVAETLLKREVLRIPIVNAG
jgi:hypothetical protein